MKLDDVDHVQDRVRRRFGHVVLFPTNKQYGIENWNLVYKDYTGTIFFFITYDQFQGHPGPWLPSRGAQKLRGPGGRHWGLFPRSEGPILIVSSIIAISITTILVISTISDIILIVLFLGSRFLPGFLRPYDLKSELWTCYILDHVRPHILRNVL